MNTLSRTAAPFLDEYAIGARPRPSGELGQLTESFIAGMLAEKPRFLGFPTNMDFRFSELAGILDIFVNNLGDPRSADKAGISSKPMECAVVDAVARLANGAPDETYGYIAASGSEANLFGLDRGCVALPDAKIYCSGAAHYSIRKAARLMRRELVVVAADATGRMDPAALAAACRPGAGRGAIVVATLSTTMTGAIDDVDAIVAAAGAAGEVYVHLDAALGGLIIPFTEYGPTWGFARPEVGSIGISMHKALGTPVVCALALCRADLVHTAIEGDYVGATDVTLGCSRSGLAGVLLWYALSGKGIAGLEADAHTSLATAAYAERALAAAGTNPMRHPASVTVVFDRPAEAICHRYHLATAGDRAHVITLPHVREAMIDALCLEITEQRGL
ncbi:aminotransferase class I/II-fold pyridoxal phosphate-dependent enzyme [Nocardia asteroides]|uniref:aminotransferase class I/II-fold pyridoxal phosphate-dependent enzyme n=1 Tax=Nocardia asteroides TaxID=1824 RepID=UPI001E2CD027|nr:aminotransferase class I/II-fold pyridoxal phosphate-dependent enzyme [Nocardia asteroides]UGT59974.1 pyridoxal-dependent decarboxylase [Nocardia asteroides]